MAEHVDSVMLAELQTLMEDNFSLLLETYLEESAQQSELASRACATGDMESLLRSAHSLKGSALNIGAHTLSELCAQVESLARADARQPVGQVLERAFTELKAVQTEVRAAHQRL